MNLKAPQGRRRGRAEAEMVPLTVEDKQPVRINRRERKQQRPQLGVPHIIGLIYIRNTAQGMSMIIRRGLRANRAEGRKKQPGEKKSLRKRDPFRSEPSASTRTQRRLSGVLPPLPDGDMDALKSAGRAIIRSPSIAKQSWAAGRHKSESVAFRTCASAAFNASELYFKTANLAKPS